RFSQGLLADLGILGDEGLRGVLVTDPMDVRRIGRERDESFDQSLVDGLPVWEVANPWVSVVARPGQDVRLQPISVGGKGGPQPVADEFLHRCAPPFGAVPTFR